MKLTDAIIVSISEMISAGKRPHEIRAKIPGLSPGLLSSALRKLGVPNFRRGRTETPLYAELRANIANKTDTLSSISRKLGVSRQRIDQIIHKDLHATRKQAAKLAGKTGGRPKKLKP